MITIHYDKHEVELAAEYIIANNRAFRNDTVPHVVSEIEDLIDWTVSKGYSQGSTGGYHVSVIDEWTDDDGEPHVVVEVTVDVFSAKTKMFDDTRTVSQLKTN